jgi:hypothetical protein
MRTTRKDGARCDSTARPQPHVGSGGRIPHCGRHGSRRSNAASSDGTGRKARDRTARVGMARVAIKLVTLWAAPEKLLAPVPARRRDVTRQSPLSEAGPLSKLISHGPAPSVNGHPRRSETAERWLRTLQPSGPDRLDRSRHPRRTQRRRERIADRVCRQIGSGTVGAGLPSHCPPEPNRTRRLSGAHWQRPVRAATQRAARPQTVRRCRAIAGPRSRRGLGSRVAGATSSRRGRALASAPPTITEVGQSSGPGHSPRRCRQLPRSPRSGSRRGPDTHRSTADNRRGHRGGQPRRRRFSWRSRSGLGKGGHSGSARPRCC